MRAHLKKAISNNIFLYYLWFKLVRKKKGLNVNFFQRDTEVYIDGYSRSGNTFIIHLVRRLLPELNTVHHLHSVAPIKIALLMKLPTFILVRDPLNCISSNYLKYFAMRGMNVSTTINDKLLELFISDYLNYYKFVLKNKNKISIILFDDLIKSPLLVLNKINDQLKINKVFSGETISRTKATYRGATTTMGSSLPNTKKEKYKSVIKEHITWSNKYMGVVKLYNQLSNQKNT